MEKKSRGTVPVPGFVLEPPPVEPLTGSTTLPVVSTRTLTSASVVSLPHQPLPHPWRDLPLTGALLEVPKFIVSQQAALGSTSFQQQAEMVGLTR